MYLRSFLTLVLICMSSLIANAQSVAKEADSKDVKLVQKGVINGTALELPKPKIQEPVKAIGKVYVRVLIDESGNVIEAKASSGHPLLRKPSEVAARKARFRPTLLSGKPVKVRGTIVYTFRPRNKDKIDLEYFEISNGIETLRYLNGRDDLKELSDDLLKDFATDPDKDFQKVFKEYPKMTVAQRNELLDSLEVELCSEAGKSKEWQIDLGKAFGRLVNEINAQLHLDKFDALALKRDLKKLSIVLSSLNGKLPEHYLIVFRELAAFKDAQNDQLLASVLLKTSEILEVLPE